MLELDHLPRRRERYWAGQDDFALSPRLSRSPKVALIPTAANVLFCAFHRRALPKACFRLYGHLNVIQRCYRAKRK
jgi:hypothetical protein